MSVPRIFVQGAGRTPAPGRRPPRPAAPGAVHPGAGGLRPWSVGEGLDRARSRRALDLVPAVVGVTATLLLLTGGATLALRFLFGG